VRLKRYNHLVAHGVTQSSAQSFGAVGQPNAFLPAVFVDIDTFYGEVRSFAAMKLQHFFTRQLEDVRHANFMASLPKVDAARIKHLSNKNAAAWRHYVHLPFFTGRPLSSTEYCLSNKFCLGLPPAPGLIQCECGVLLIYPPDHPLHDPGHHQSCPNARKAARNSAHDLVKVKMGALANKCGVPNQNEAKMAGTNKRPDGCALFPWSAYLHDTTIRHPNCLSYLEDNSAGTDKVLQKAVNTKVTRYATDKPILDAQKKVIGWTPSLAKRKNAGFLTLAMTTYGDMHEDCCKFLRMLSAEAVNNGICTEAKRGQFYAAMVAEVSTQIMRGNAWTATRHIRTARVATRKGGQVRVTAGLRKVARNAAAAAVVDVLA
jgi:hypothetical protein